MAHGSFLDHGSGCMHLNIFSGLVFFVSLYIWVRTTLAHRLWLSLLVISLHDAFSRLTLASEIGTYGTPRGAFDSGNFRTLVAF